MVVALPEVLDQWAVSDQPTAEVVQHGMVQEPQPAQWVLVIMCPMVRQHTEVMQEFQHRHQRLVFLMRPEAQGGVQAAKVSLDPALLHLISMAWGEEVAVTLVEQPQQVHRHCPLDTLAEPVAVVEQVTSMSQILPADQPAQD